MVSHLCLLAPQILEAVPRGEVGGSMGEKGGREESLKGQLEWSAFLIAPKRQNQKFKSR